MVLDAGAAILSLSVGLTIWEMRNKAVDREIWKG